MKKSFIYIAFFFVLALIYFNGAMNLYTNYKNNYHMAPIGFYRFDTTEINGHLNFISRDGYMECFSIKEDSNKYYSVLLRYADSKNKYGIFKYDAELGDSVIKYKHSDTLILFRGKSVHLYKIERPTQ